MNKSVLHKTFDPKRLQRTVFPEEFGGMQINPDFKDLLVRLDFTDFNRVFNFSGGDVFKNIKERSVARIDLTIGGCLKTFYLKRHNAETIKKRPRIFFKTGTSSKSQGILEFENIIDFRSNGLATVTPVAAGEKKVGGDQVASFLLTEDFSPFVQLEWLLFNRPEYFTGTESAARKKVLLEKIARFARNMHKAGFNHKDFNATHILLGFVGNLTGPPEIAVFDLQRVDRSKINRFRWIIKSLAELNYTLLDEYFSDMERSHLFLSYKGGTNRGLLDRLQRLWIKQKTARIARHTINLKRRRGSGK
jgi:heptose I phosphotransferase